MTGLPSVFSASLLLALPKLMFGLSFSTRASACGANVGDAGWVVGVGVGVLSGGGVGVLVGLGVGVGDAARVSTSSGRAPSAASRDQKNAPSDDSEARSN